MSDLQITEKPRLYLDIDGVIIADNSPFETVSLNRIENYAPEVVSRLGATGLELVWLSSWEGQATQLSDVIESLNPSRILRLARLHRDDSCITRKRISLIHDQLQSPSPFVWVDDMITPWAKRRVKENLKAPKLFVKPDTITGLNEANLQRIEEFAKSHQVAK